MLGQADIAKYLDMCDNDPAAIDEVLRAYVSWKVVRGSSNARVVHKIHYLMMFLKATGRTDILRTGRESFRATAAELKRGECRGISSEAARTPAGIQAFNAIRRYPKYKAYFAKAQKDHPDVASSVRSSTSTFDPLDWSLMSFSLRQHPAHRFSGTSEQPNELRRGFVDEDENGVVPPAYSARAGPGTWTVQPQPQPLQRAESEGLPDYVQ